MTCKQYFPGGHCMQRKIRIPISPHFLILCWKYNTATLVPFPFAPPGLLPASFWVTIPALTDETTVLMYYLFDSSEVQVYSLHWKGREYWTCVKKLIELKQASKEQWQRKDFKWHYNVFIRANTILYSRAYSNISYLLNPCWFSPSYLFLYLKLTC